MEGNPFSTRPRRPLPTGTNMDDLAKAARECTLKASPARKIRNDPSNVVWVLPMAR
jgi:hypothetical protein